MNLTEPMEFYVADFRKCLPEFDETNYPDDSIELSLIRNKKFIGSLWGEYYSPLADSWARDGWFARSAHFLMLSRQFFDAIESGEIPAPFRGIDSTTIQDESITFGSQIMLKLSPWNESLSATPYGMDFLEMRNTIEKKAPTFR